LEENLKIERGNKMKTLKQIKRFLKKYTFQIAGLLLGLSLFWIGLWQIDLICAPYIWQDKKIIEVLPFWYMYNTEAYVMFFSWVMIGLFLIIVALWYWD